MCIRDSIYCDYLKVCQDNHRGVENAKDISPNSDFLHCSCLHTKGHIPLNKLTYVSQGDNIEMKDMHSDVAVFWEKFGTESLFSPDVVSQRCKECRKCSCTISKREVLSEIEAEFLEKNIRFDPIEKKMEVQYITEGHLSPDEFVDNQKSVLGFARKTNDKMSKLPVNDVEGYNDNLQKAIGMGAIQNYNDFEIKHPKIKSLKQRFVRGSYAYSGKASTKLRPIFDQSQTSPGEAIAPNSYWTVSYTHLTLPTTPYV